MELFLFLLVAGAAAGLWLNYVLNKKNKEQQVQEEPAPYKIESKLETTVEPSKEKQELIQVTLPATTETVKKPKATTKVGARTKKKISEVVDIKKPSTKKTPSKKVISKRKTSSVTS